MFEVTMVLVAETKGALRYQEIDESSGQELKGNDAKIGTLYIRKTTFGIEVPKRIVVSVRRTRILPWKDASTFLDIPADKE